MIFYLRSFATAVVLGGLMAIILVVQPSTKADGADPTNETPPNFKIAFVGDSGLDISAQLVFELIRDEGTDMVLHLGDFDYAEDPAGWEQLIDEVLGESFPFFAVVGNHDVRDWVGRQDGSHDAVGYRQRLLLRLNRVQGAYCDGDYGVNAACTYNGIFFILSGAGTLGHGHTDFIVDQLARTDATWRICGWHQIQVGLHVGNKQSAVGPETYEACREGNAIIATAHEHSYHRTKTLNNMEFQIVDPDWPSADLVRVGGGSTFAFVSGLGGNSIRNQERCWQRRFRPYACHQEWARIYASDQGANHGALFIEFHVDGDPNKAIGYFKNIDGKVIDHFTILAGDAKPATNIEEELGFLGDSLERVWWLNEGTGEWALYDPRRPFAELNTLTVLRKGHLYWLKINGSWQMVRW